MSQTVVEQLSSLALRLDYEYLPKEVIHQAKRIILDSLGCALGAYEDVPCRAVRQAVAPFAIETLRPAYARPIGRTSYLPAPLASLVSGTLIRCFDINDVLWGRGRKGSDPSHPSGNLSVALACADMVGGGGKEVILGLVLGYEMQIRFVDHAGDPNLWDRGWDHSTTMAFSSASIAARLMNLSETQAAHALALAVTHGCTLGEVRCGQIPMHKASVEAFNCKTGIECALLAQAGLTGPLNVLTGRLGFERAVAGECDFDAMLAPIPDKQYRIMRSCLKSFPAKGQSQTTIQAAIDVAGENEITASEIDEVGVKLYHYALKKPNWDKEKYEPTTRETADHSFPYLVAVALARRKLTFEQYDADHFEDATIRKIMANVSLEGDDELTKLFPETMPAEVTVKTSRGIFSKRVDYWRGHPKNPMTDKEVEEKFRQLTKHILSTKRQDRIFATVWKLEELNKLDQLFESLAVGGKD